MAPLLGTHCKFPNPLANLRILLVIIYLLIDFIGILAASQPDPKFIDWETEKPLKKIEADAKHLYFDSHGKLFANGWVAGSSDAFKLFFVEDKSTSSAKEEGQCPATEKKFRIRACMTGPSCKDGFLVCFIGQLDPANAPDLMKQFRLDGITTKPDGSTKPNPLVEKCVSEAAKWTKEWASKAVHGMRIAVDEHDNITIHASYSDKKFAGKMATGRCFNINVGDLSVPEYAALWKGLQNGEFLRDLSPLLTVPLDILSHAFNHTEPILAVIGISAECKLQLAFEGKQLEQCLNKDCTSYIGKKQCTAEWSSAKPAKLEDRMMMMHGGKEQITTVQGEHVVRGGFLKKPQEKDGPADFEHLKKSWENRKTTTNLQMEDHIKELLYNAEKRDLKETENYDYITVPEEMVTKGQGNVEVLVHTCSGDIEFVSAVRQVQNIPKQAAAEPDYNWSEDFDELKYCCMHQNKDWEPKKVETTKMLLGENPEWPKDGYYFKQVPVGYSFDSKFIDRKDLLAAKYKYTMSGAMRPFYVNLNLSLANKTHPFMDGRFFMPPKQGTWPVKMRNVNVMFNYPSQDFAKTWEDHVLVQVRQYVVNCSRCAENSKTLLHDAIFHVPRLVGVEIEKKDYAKERKRNSAYDLISAFLVDGHGPYNGPNDSVLWFDAEYWAGKELEMDNN